MKEENVKILFEVDKNDIATMQLTGDKTAVKSGMIYLISKMAEEDGVTTLELLDDFSHVVAMAELPSPVTRMLEDIFGGKK